MTPAVRTWALAAAVAASCGAAAAAPTPVVSPYIDPGNGGAPRVGSAVRGYAGVWSDAPASVAYAWERCRAACEAIPGAAGVDYTPTDADAGLTLRLKVTARYPSSPSPTAYSQESAPVAPAPRPEPVAPASAAPTPAAPTQPSPPAPAPAAPEASPRAATHPADAATAAGAGWVRVAGAGRARAFGARLVVAGFVDPGAAGRTVAVVDPSGAVVGTAVAAADGSFRAAATTRLPGVWTARADGATASFPVRVRPRIVLTHATRAVRRPGVVAVTGRITPGVAGKYVDLQYLDPRRGWRVWRRVRTAPGGRFRVARVVARAPGVGPFTLRVRVAVPMDVGWIFAPAVYPARPVRVR